MAKSLGGLFKSLRMQITLAIAIAVPIPFIILAYILSTTMTSTTSQLIGSDLTEKTYLVARDIDRQISQNLTYIQILTQANVLESGLPEDIEKYFEEIVRESDVINALHALDENGETIASYNSNGEGLEFSRENVGQEIQLWLDLAVHLDQGEIFVSEPIQGTVNPNLLFITPITDDTNTIIRKVLVVEISLDIIQDIVTSFSQRIIGDKHVYLVDNDGLVILTNNPDQALFEPFIDINSSSELLTDITEQGRNGFLQYKSANGQEVLTGWADMAEFGVNQSLDWTILAIAPFDEITKPVITLRNYVIWVAFGAIIISLALALIASSALNKPIQKLIKRALLLEKGNYKTVALIKGPLEIEHLSKVLNDAAVKIGMQTDELKFARKKAEAEEKAKAAFLATASHELRTPLTSIMGGVGMIKSGALGKVPSKAGQMIEIITQNTQRLISLVNDILDLEKISQNEIIFNIEEVNLDDVANSAADVNGPYAREYGVKIKTELGNGAKIINSDYERLVQVLTNLLSNAIKFTPKGETVKIKTLVKGDGLRGEVIDHGPGIPEEFREKVFERFTQVDESDTREKGGTGLGLNICKEMIERLGGTIGVDSTDGKGSVFYFEF